MSSRWIGLLILTVLVFTPIIVEAAVPQLINYQGYLTDSGGTPVNGTVTITFSLYEVQTGGAALWAETQSAVQVNKGVYSVILGSTTPVTLAFDAQYYLGVKIEGDDEMTPRQPLVSAPYALRAVTAENAACIPGDFLFCYSGITGTMNVGPCRAGVRTCTQEGLFGDCVGAVLPAAQDLCTGVDDNCNGVVNDGCSCDVGQTLTCGLGACYRSVACSTGHETCVKGTPQTEVCNGIDDDCDGTVDDGNPGGGGACVTGQPGICSAGTVQCSSGALTCIQNLPSQPEVCNGLDDDCNGQVDDAPEVCNGLDDDCDGQVDEEGAQGCVTYFNDSDRDGFGVGAGRCLCSPAAPYDSLTSNDCNDTNPNVHPGQPEVCNGIDDNCNGFMDYPEVPLSSICPNTAHVVSTQCGGSTGCRVALCETNWYDVNVAYSDGCEVQWDARDQGNIGNLCSSSNSTGLHESPQTDYQIDITGNIVPAGDVDWYAVYAYDDDTNGVVRFAVQFESNPANEFRYDLYAGTCSNLVASGMTGQTLRLTGSIYYVKVYRVDGNASGYNYTIRLSNNVY